MRKICKDFKIESLISSYSSGNGIWLILSNITLVIISYVLVVKFWLLKFKITLNSSKLHSRTVSEECYNIKQKFFNK